MGLAPARPFSSICRQPRRKRAEMPDKSVFAAMMTPPLGLGRASDSCCARRVFGGRLSFGALVSPRLRSAARWLLVARCPNAPDDRARVAAKAQYPRLANPGDLHHRPWHRFLAIAAMKAGAFDFIKKPLLREWGSSRRWQFAPERHRRTRDYRKIAVRRHHRTNLSKNAILSRIYLQRQVFSYGDMASMHRVNSLLYLR